MSRAPTVGDHRSRRILLALILLSGLALRLVYASHGPHGGRFEDEKHALRNVVGIVVNGSLAPASVYYPSPVFTLPPSALVAAANALHRATGNPALLAIDERGVSHPAAYLVCRLLMVIYGTVAIYLIFLVGRRLFSDAAGLLAAAMLAYMPWMIHSSGYFKPDPLVVMTVLLAFWASLRAVAERRTAAYLLAGLAIALAASSKLTGVVIALPLTVATVISWRDRRGWGLLAAAGATSIVSFALLNPYGWAYPRFVAGLRVDYAMRAEWKQQTRADIPGELLELMLGRTGHGPLLGALALAGLVGLALRAWRRGAGGAERTRLVMLLVFPPAFLAVYAAQTAYFKSNNFLPVLAFTTLAAAWSLAATWRWVARRWPPLASRSASLAAIAASALLIAPPGLGYVHASLVPSTEDLVRRLLHERLRPGLGRTAVVEPAARRGSIWEGAVGSHVAQIEVERLTDLPPAELDVADAEIFAEERLHGPAAAFYRRRMERLEADQVRIFRPRFPSLRGPALVALIHRRRALGKPQKLELQPCDDAPTCLEARLPAAMVPRERFSLALRAPLMLALAEGSLRPLQVGERLVEPIQTGRSPTSVRATTRRLFVDDPAATTIRFTAGTVGRRSTKIWLLRWAGGPRAAPPERPPRPARAAAQKRLR